MGRGTGYQGCARGGAIALRWGMRIIPQDLRYALRMLLKRPGFTAIAIFTLTLGIGVNVAVFAIVSRVVLAPLDYPQAERLVKISGLGRAAGGRAANLSRLDFRDTERANRTFESLGAFSAGIGAVTITAFGEAERVKARWPHPIRHAPSSCALCATGST